MKAILLAFAAAGTLVAAAVDVAWAQVVLASHRAIYDISLSTTSGATALESAEGRFVLELSAACDAYIFNQRFVVRWEYSEGEDVLQDDVLASWEAKTGTAFRFDSTSRVNGTLEEHYRGRAELEAAGQAGAVVYKQPDIPEQPLASGTMFPSAHVTQLISSARSGTQQVTRNIYDGSGPDGHFHAVAFIGEVVPASEAEQRELFQNVISWRIRVAYYSLDEEIETLALELDYRLYANGIASSFVLDYGETVLEGKLVELSAVPAAC